MLCEVAHPPKQEESHGKLNQIKKRNQIDQQGLLGLAEEVHSVQNQKL